jgi:predicted Rossmann fold nucleotide-binding protein DprA/Smf involved in DNA uptake
MSLPGDAVSRLRLIRTDSIGPVTYRQLIARFGDAETALKALPDQDLEEAVCVLGKVADPVPL